MHRRILSYNYRNSGTIVGLGKTKVAEGFLGKEKKKKVTWKKRVGKGYTEKYVEVQHKNHMIVE